MFLFHSTLFDRLDREVFKLTYEFLLLIVIGGAVSLVYKTFEIEKEKREANRNFMRELHNDIVKTYNGVKKVRRLLRAKARDRIIQEDAYQILAKPYGKQLIALNDLQLDFEYFKFVVKNHPSLFSRRDYLEKEEGTSHEKVQPTNKENLNLETDLKSMEGYLHDIVKEYEDHFLEVFKAGVMKLERLHFLNEFLSRKDDEKEFNQEFKMPFHRVAVYLERLVVS